jgi:hypothetical protein
LCAVFEEVTIVRLSRNQYGSGWVATAVLGLAVWLVPALASAQIAPGVRAGASVDPDQVYVGGHLETQPIYERLVFRPNVEVGFGDNLTLAGFNFEFAWKFPQRSGPWGFYAAAGPAINLYRYDGPGDDAKAGFNFVGGVENDRGFFFEFKVGADNSPAFKFGVGMTFR